MRRDSAVPRLHVGCTTTYTRKEEKKQPKATEKYTHRHYPHLHTCPQEHTSLKRHTYRPPRPPHTYARMRTPAEAPPDTLANSTRCTTPIADRLPVPPHPSALLSGEQAHTMRQQRSALRDGRKVLNPPVPPPPSISIPAASLVAAV